VLCGEKVVAINASVTSIKQQQQQWRTCFFFLCFNGLPECIKLPSVFVVIHVAGNAGGFV